MRKTRKRFIYLCVMVLAITLLLPCSVFGSSKGSEEPSQVYENNSQAGDPANPGESTDPTNETTTESTTETTTESTTETTTAPTKPVEPADPIDAMGVYSSHTYPKYTGKNTKSIPVITYHYLCTPEEKDNVPEIKDNDIYLSSSVFEEQMKWLFDHGYRTINLTEFYKWHKKKMKLPKKSVLITFDDGDYNSIRYGVPILAKYGFKATMFVVGSWTGNTTDVDLDLLKQYKGSRERAIGTDKINQVRSKYPDLTFEGHSWNLHYRVNDMPVAKTYSWKTQKNDFNQQVNTFGYKYMAYPYGYCSKSTFKAAKKSKVKMAFKYGGSAKATIKQNVYKIRRIKISAEQPMSGFTRWFYN